MTIVYVVTTGSYSDYSIEGVFSSREKAEAHMGGKPDQFNNIEEYELDTLPVTVWGHRWDAHLLRDGTETNNMGGPVREHDTQSFLVECSNIKESSYLWTNRTAIKKEQHDYNREHNQRPWFQGISYKSYSHAVKLAVELRQKTLREHPDWFE